VAALERLMGPDYLQIDEGGGTVDKEQVLASFRSGERYWAEARSDEHHVRVYGDAAVVGRWRARGHNGAHPFDYQARYVSVWIRRDGRWRIVSDQSTPTT
jgi:ketosteroid isomerase-like protein